MALIINLVIIFITGFLRGSIMKKGSQLKYWGSSTGTKALHTQMELQANDMEKDYVRKNILGLKLGKAMDVLQSTWSMNPKRRWRFFQFT